MLQKKQVSRIIFYEGDFMPSRIITWEIPINVFVYPVKQYGKFERNTNRVNPWELLKKTLQEQNIEFNADNWVLFGVPYDVRKRVAIALLNIGKPELLHAEILYYCLFGHKEVMMPERTRTIMEILGVGNAENND